MSIFSDLLFTLSKPSSKYYFPPKFDQFIIMLFNAIDSLVLRLSSVVGFSKSGDWLIHMDSVS